MRIGGEGKRKKEWDTFDFRGEDWKSIHHTALHSSAQLCKAMNRKKHLSKSQEEKRKSIIYMKNISS